MSSSTQSSAPETVILLGTDTPIGLAVVRDLGRHGFRVVGLGRSETAIAAASRHCHHHAVREASEHDLVAQISALVRRWEASYLLAISENDLLLLNRHRADFASHLKVLVPSRDQLAQVLDKATCQHQAQAVNIPVPQTWVFATLQEARDAAGSLPYPVVLKWSDPNRVAAALSAAGLPLVKTGYAKDAEALIRQLTPYAAIGAFPMVQSYCAGHGLGQMFLVDDGEVLLEFQHERLHEWPPEGGISTLCISVPLSRHGEIRALSRALLKRLKWTGVAMVEYRYDPRTARYVFMEVNGRFWGSLPLAIAAGLPFAAALVARCGGSRLPVAIPRDYPVLIGCYWIPETRRLFRVLFQRREISDPFYRPDPLVSLLSYLTLPLRPSIRWFVFQFADPKPFFSDLTAVLGKALRRLL